MNTPLTGGRGSLNLAIRKQLDVFANVCSIQSRPGITTRHSKLDIVIIRENIEGEYSGLEHQPSPGIIESLKICTRYNSERIIKFAFDYAIKYGRKKITCIHKANIMYTYKLSQYELNSESHRKLSDGLFLKVFREIAQKYSSYGIQIEDMIVDNASMQLVSNPNQFDVIVAPNLFGNIASNIGASLIGGPGLVPAYSIGKEYAIFEHVNCVIAIYAFPFFLCSLVDMRVLILLGRMQPTRFPQSFAVV